MKNLFLFCLLCYLSVNSTFAQIKKIDSLRAVIRKHPQADTFRVNRLIDLAFSESPDLLTAQRDSLATVALQLSRRLDYPFGQAAALFYQAVTKISAGQQKAGQELAKQALPLAERSNRKDFLFGILETLSMFSQGRQRLDYSQRALSVGQPMSMANKVDRLFQLHGRIVSEYINEGNYPVALQQGMSLLAKVEKDTNSIHQFLALSDLATISTRLKDYDQALIYLKRSQFVARKRRDKAQQGATLVRIGKIYQHQEQHDKAIETFKQALPYVMNLREDWVINIEYELSSSYEQKGLHQQAFSYAHRALAEIQTKKDVFNYFDGYKITIFKTLSQTHLHTGQLDSALYYGLKCLQYARKEGDKQFLRDANETLAEVYAAQKDYADAYRYQSEFMALKDSLNNEDVTRRTTATQFTFEMDKQKSQIAFLHKTKQLQEQAARQQKILIIFLVATLLMLAVLATVLLLNNRQKQKANRLLTDQRDQTQQALTELKATQQQLVQKEKMASLGELTAGIAHEIQNPLNFVNNFSEVSTELVDELEDEYQKASPDKGLEAELLSDLKQNLQKITQHGQRASSIVKGMLEHSRSSTGEVQPTDLNALADEYLRLAYHGQRAKDKNFNCELITHFDPAIGQVNMVSQELGRVLLNLFTNAFYAVRERQKQGDFDYQPKVSVSTSKTKAGIEIRVADNGTGMPETVKQKIFQPFFTTKPTGEGTGLGLSLSYDIITKGHGGTMGVESQPDEGTQMIVRLPA